MFRIDSMSRTPVYEQIIEETERYVTAGIMRPGDKMPSVRGLSVELAVNPNTIQKAYSELDSLGIIVSVPGKGCFITEKADKVIREKSLGRLLEIQSLAANLYGAGVSEEDILSSVMSGISERNGHK